MKSPKRIDGILIGLGFLMGLLTALSILAWQGGLERGRHELRQAKEELVGSAGLFELHNKIYSRVGDRVWRDQVRPEFMSAVTWETVRETGALMPSPEDIIAWVKAHPEKARRLLLEASER